MCFFLWNAATLQKENSKDWKLKTDDFNNKIYLPLEYEYFNKEYIYYSNKLSNVQNVVHMHFTVSELKKKKRFEGRLSDVKSIFFSVFDFLCIDVT